jgi:diaminopimelate epimerase
MAIMGAPEGGRVEALANGELILLSRTEKGVGIRMPEGADFGLRTPPVQLELPAGFGWIGNPQLVLRVPSVTEVDLETLAPPLRHHPGISGGTNVNVVQVLAPGEARIRSWERGVEGETLCCGTGCAVAAAWLASTEGLRAWRLHTAGGAAVDVELALDAEGRWRDLWLTGPVLRLGVVTPDPALLTGLQR